MDVNAVPPMRREYTLPRKPTANAPMAETTSERLKIKWFATLFAAYEMHEMTTITTRSHATGCSLFSELSTENTGTIANCVHHGNGCRYHGNDDGR